MNRMLNARSLKAGLGVGCLVLIVGGVDRLLPYLYTGVCIGLSWNCAYGNKQDPLLFSVMYGKIVSGTHKCSWNSGRAGLEEGPKNSQAS
jgi:hypothetical protein